MAEDFLVGLLSKLMKTLERRDIDEVRQAQKQILDQLQAQINEIGSDVKKMAPELIYLLLELVEPVVVNGQVNQHHFLFHNLPDLKDNFTARLEIYKEVEMLYQDTFKQFLRYSHDKSIDVTWLQVSAFHLTEIFEKKYLSRIGQLDLSDGLSIFKRLFSFFEKNVILFAEAIHLQREKTKFEEPTFPDAMKYLSSLDKRFKKIYYKRVKKIFRIADAHDLAIEVNENKGYIMNKGVKEYFTNAELFDAIINLIVLVVSLIDVFWARQFYEFLQEKLLALQEESQDHVKLNNLAWKYYREKQYEKSLKLALKAVKIDSTYDFAWDTLACAYYGLKDYQKSWECFQQMKQPVEKGKRTEEVYQKVKEIIQSSD